MVSGRYVVIVIHYKLDFGRLVLASSDSLCRLVLASSDSLCM